jgi:hypothetical protein
MQEKNKNEEKAKQEFEKRIKETKLKAIEENKKIAKESGNKLTQNVDKDGNLIGVGTTSIENTLNAESSSADIRRELFEGDNIRTKAFDKEQKKLQTSEDAETSNVNIKVTEKDNDN